MGAVERFIPKLSLSEMERRRLEAGAEISEQLKISGMLPRGFRARLARKYGVSEGAVTHWVDTVQKEGVEGLRGKPQGGSEPWLDAGQREHLRELLLMGAMAHGWETDAWSARRVAQLIDRTFGVRYDVKYVSQLLRNQLGFSYQKPARVPRELNPAKVEAWFKDSWVPTKKGRLRAS